MNLADKIRFTFTALFKNAEYNMNLLSMKNKKFFNNSGKISGWYNGYPSFNVYAPPVFSKPSVNALVTKVMSLYQWRKLPEIMSIAMTDKCNASCRHCSFTTVKKETKPLTTDEYINIIRQAQDLGISTISMVGGEPLLNPDIIKIIDSTDKDLSQLVMFTNGYYLADMANELKKVGLTTIIVSIDSYDKEKHDSNKGSIGFFERAIKGIEKSKKSGLLTAVSFVVHKEDLYNENLVKIFDFSKNMKIGEVILFEAIPKGNYAGRNDLLWTEEDRLHFFNLCEKYQNNDRYPVIFSYSHLKSSKGIGCSGGVLYFYVSPYGDICPCDFNNFIAGNIRSTSLHSIWDRFNIENGYASSCLSGCRSQTDIKN